MWLIVHVQLLNNVGDHVSVKLKGPGGPGSAVLDIYLAGLSESPHIPGSA